MFGLLLYRGMTLFSGSVAWQFHDGHYEIVKYRGPITFALKMPQHKHDEILCVHCTALITAVTLE